MENLLVEDEKYLLKVYHRLPIIIKRAKGVYLYDNKGKRYLDMFSGISVSPLGHLNPLIIKAIRKQIKKYLHLSNYFVCDSVVDLAKLLVKNSFASKVFFTNSGTEAIEASIKLVRKYGKTINPEKIEIITIEESFHGRTIGALSLTSQKEKQQMFEPLLPGVVTVKRNDIEDLRKKVTNRTCAIFLELVQGESGIKLLNQEFLDEISLLAKENQFLIVIDEIQSGLLRTGSLFTYQQFNITPDILTLAKSLGGGLPLGAMLVSKKLEDVLSYGEHGSTFGGNPLACAAGVSLFSSLINPTFQKNVKEKSFYFLSKLNKLKNNYPTIIKDVRGLGLMIGIDVSNYASLFQKKLIKKGILINITHNTVIRLLPPLIIKYSHINYFLKSMQEIIEEHINES